MVVLTGGAGAERVQLHHVQVVFKEAQSEYAFAWHQDGHYAVSGEHARGVARAGGPADARDTFGLFFVQAIHAARKRLWIVSPYFVPNGSIIDALRLAALRGVDVRILLPQNADNRLVQFAGYAYVPELVDQGVKLYRYRGGILHQKALLVDDDLAAIGTANLDNRSFRLNFEILLLVADTGFATSVEHMLAGDFDRRDGIALRRAAKPALQMGHEAEQPAAWVMFRGHQAPLQARALSWREG